MDSDAMSNEPEIAVLRRKRLELVLEARSQRQRARAEVERMKRSNQEMREALRVAHEELRRTEEALRRARAPSACTSDE